MRQQQTVAHKALIEPGCHQAVIDRSVRPGDVTEDGSISPEIRIPPDREKIRLPFHRSPAPPGSFRFLAIGLVQVWGLPGRSC